ncbi:MAG: hypothetical protein ACRBCS_04745 [Cellvibrionaceae bacterium]
MRQPRASHVGVTFNNTVFLKARLNDEIVRLERQLNDLRSGEQASNFGLVQSYKEMIYSRKEMLSGLPH